MAHVDHEALKSSKSISFLAVMYILGFQSFEMSTRKITYNDTFTIPHIVSHILYYWYN